MGNLIKINMYSEIKRGKKKNLKLENIEKVISAYNIWLEKTNREDRIENYEKFLRAQ